jgi:amidase
MGVLRALPLRPLLLKALDEAAHGPLAATPNTQLFNMTGQPAISLPLSWSAAGLPIGTQWVAPFGREDMLLRLASQLEAARPWSTRRPRAHATDA